MISNCRRGSISVLMMIKGSSRQRVTGTQSQWKPAETPPRCHLLSSSSSPLPTWHFWSSILGRLPSPSASQPKQCRVRNARLYRCDQHFAPTEKSSQVSEQLPRGFARPLVDLCLLCSWLILLHSEWAASSSCVAFKCYHSDE